MLVIINIGNVNQRILSWEEAVEEFNLSRTAMYGRETTLSCGTTLTFMREPAKGASRGLCANLIHSIDVKNIAICNEISNCTIIVH